MTRISGAELKARLAAFARDVGFDSCRIAACNAPVHTTEFRDWLRQHAHGEMDYMQRGEEKRCDPQKVLPGAPRRPQRRSYRKDGTNRTLRVG